MQGGGCGISLCLYAELIDDARKRKIFGDAGRKRVQEKFAGTVVVKNWKEYYDQLLSYV